MYAQGSLVTLARAKEHYDGQDTLKLKEGTCGIIVQQRKRNSNGNHEYVVDFGSYGQWHCMHEEMNGDDSEGWDVSGAQLSEPPRVETVSILTNTNGIVDINEFLGIFSAPRQGQQAPLDRCHRTYAAWPYFVGMVRFRAR